MYMNLSELMQILYMLKMYFIRNLLRAVLIIIFASLWAFTMFSAFR